MNISQGPHHIDDTLTFSVTTHAVGNGTLTDADAVPAFRVYEDETGTAILTGNMSKLDDTNTTGFYSEQLTLSAANGFEAGKSYNIYVSAAVNSITGATSGGFKVSGAISANVVQVSGDSTAADNLEAILDGTGGNITGNLTGSVGSVTGNVGGNVVGTTGNITGTPTVNLTLISGDATAADNLEAAFDGTGATITGNLTGSIGSLGAQAKADVNAEVDTALADYDAPTKTELDSAIAALNDLSASEIRDALGLASANLDTQLADLPTNAELSAALAAADDAVLAVIASLNDLSAADIRTALGLATANLDTQLADLPTNSELSTALAAADDAVLAAIASLNDLSAAEVNAEVDTALSDYDGPTKAELDTAQAAILTKLLAYIRLLVRKDAATATDQATELTAINADAGSGAGTFTNTTDSVEAIRDQGDAAWTTGGGGGGGGNATIEKQDEILAAVAAANTSIANANGTLHTAISSANTSIANANTTLHSAITLANTSIANANTTLHAAVAGANTSIANANSTLSLAISGANTSITAANTSIGNANTTLHAAIAGANTSIASANTTLHTAISNIDAGGGTGAYTITVTVTDGTDPLENATVRLTEGINTFVQYTDASGNAQFSLDAATYNVALTKDGYSFTPTTRTVTGEEAGTLTSDLEMTLTTLISPADPPYCSVHGTVINGLGLPVANASISFSLVSANNTSRYGGPFFTLDGVLIQTTTILGSTDANGTLGNGTSGSTTLDLIRNDYITPDSVWYLRSSDVYLRDVDKLTLESGSFHLGNLTA